jgi:hypothetical protein
MTLTLSFHRKSEDDDRDSGEGKSKARPRPAGERLVTSRFELPGTFTPTDAHRGVAERAVNKFLRDLLRRAECIDATTESVSAAEDATAERHEAKPMRLRNIMKERSPKNVRTLLDDAVDSLTADWTVAVVPSME